MAEVERRSFHYFCEAEATARKKERSVRVHNVDDVLWEGGRPEQPCLDRTSLGQFGGRGHLNPSNMCPCERPVMLVVQDETIVRQYDCKKCFWGSEDMRMLLRKTYGRGFVFSGFLTEEVGVPVPNFSDEVLTMANANRRDGHMSHGPGDRQPCMRLTVIERNKDAPLLCSAVEKRPHFIRFVSETNTQSPVPASVEQPSATCRRPPTMWPLCSTATTT